MKNILKAKSFKINIILLLSIFLLTFFANIAYSAISSTMLITGISYSRVDADVRITDFKLNELSQNVITTYQEFSKESIASNITLPNDDSYIIYKIEVTNYGSSDIAIKKITGKNSKLTYELIDYSLKEKLCNNNGKCNNLAVKEFYLKIYGSKGTYDINLFFDFKPFLSISYQNITNNNYPTEILYDETLNIDIGINNAKGIIVKSSSGEIDNYSYKNGILLIPSVKENLTIEGVSYESNYTYTGSYQEFRTPYKGIYKIELWGAQGGNSGGQGGYTSGLIDLKKDEQLYLYIGGVGGASPVGAAATIAGGYNGGGITKGQDCCYRVFGTGGGATDIRLTSGTWNDFNSLKSRIMVAAGGGGRFSAQSSGGTISAGGAAGGLIGLAGVNTDYCAGQGGTQTLGGKIGTTGKYCTAGTQVGYTDPGKVTGGFGTGGSHGEQGNAGTGGGGGYYGGSSSGHIAGAGGGSSFISGHEGCDAIDESSTETSIIHTSQSIHYSNHYFTNTTMIDGAGYSWTTTQEATIVGMPSPTTSSTMTGNTGNGYAKITFIEMTKELNEQIEITKINTKETNDATSNDEKFTTSTINTKISLNSSNSYILYEIDVTNSGSRNMTIKNINNLSEELSYELINYTFKEKISGKTTQKITLKIYGTPGEYNLELDFEFISMQTITYKNLTNNNYQQEIATGDTLVVNIGSSNAPGILVKIGDNLIDNYSYQNGILTVPNVTDDIVIEGFSYKITYGYKGNYETFTTPYSGVYKVELWGASGEDKNDYRGGYGAYVSGLIELEQNTNLYIYVGSDTGQFNGKSLSEAEYGGGGGGSTDVRLTSGSWKDFESLKSRIIVAGAGGGGDNRTSGYGDGIGGDAGGLIGYDGESINHTNGYGYSNSYGGTQTKAYLMYWNNLGSATTPTGFRDLTGVVYRGVEYSNAGFGSGGTSQSGGGSGYYGGAGGDHSGGAGGSSFISGHNGCDAIAESSTSTNITHTGQSIHYSNYYFTNTTMIDGQGYSWTTEKGSLTGMPTHDGTGTMTGNKGAGYIKITLIEIKK